MDNVTEVSSWKACDGIVSPALFRQALGRFGSGVTVLSVTCGDSYRAMTANAFMSISMDPPLVAVSIGCKARFNEHVALGSRIGISVLSQSQQSLALHFGGRPDPGMQVALHHVDGVPLMQGSAACFVAELDRIHEAGDHRIFVLRLLFLDWKDQPPLLFAAGRFGDFDPRLPAMAAPTIPDFWC